MKLNLGCGFNKKDGYVNVDKDAFCRPDQVVDLEKFPWPFADNSVDEVLADHVMEHLGQTPEAWLGIWKELYRVCKSDGRILIHVPHPRHDNFITDPTHVRPVMPGTIAMFDQMRNIRDFENHGQETKLGLLCGIDIELAEVAIDLNEPWLSRHKSGGMTDEQLRFDLNVLFNVCYQIRMLARVIKPARGTEWFAAIMESKA